MHRLFLYSVLLGFVFIPLPTFAQETALTPEQRQAASMKLMPYIYTSIADLYGRGATLGNLFVEFGDAPGFMESAGTTAEQHAEFGQFAFQVREDMRPAFDPILQRAIASNSPEDLSQIATEMSAVLSGTMDESVRKLEEILTPEQITRLRELDFQMVSPMVERGFPLINYDAYLALNLNERQRENLDKIRSDFARDQKEYFDEFAKLFPAPGTKRTPEMFQELDKKLKSQAEGGKKLVARIQASLVTMLDKDQEKRLSDLKTNIPDYVKEYLKKRGMAPKPVDEEAYSKWRDSWKPGQPIPPEFREREKARRKPFPMM